MSRCGRGIKRREKSEEGKKKRARGKEEKGIKDEGQKMKSRVCPEFCVKSHPVFALTHPQLKCGQMEKVTDIP